VEMFKEEMKKSAGGTDNERRKREALVEEIDDDGKVQTIAEKGEEQEELPLSIKDFQKKAMDFTQENYHKFLTTKKKKPKNNKEKTNDLIGR